MPICFMLFIELVRRAASRAACTAGKSNATSTPGQSKSNTTSAATIATIAPLPELPDGRGA